MGEKLSSNEAIAWLLAIAENEGEEIQIYDKDVEAIKIAIQHISAWKRLKATIENLDSDVMKYANAKKVILELMNKIFEETCKQNESIN